MFEDSHEKLSQLYLLTLRVVNGVECTTRRMVYHLNIPEHQPVMMSSVSSVYSETWWGRISLTKRYNDFHFHWIPKYLCVYNLEKQLSLADNKFTGCRIEK